MKEIQDVTNRWRDILFSWIGEINIVKMTILPKAIYKFNAIPIKLPMVFFYRTRTKNVMICMETQKTPNSQSNLNKEKQSWRTQPSWLQTILQSYRHQEYGTSTKTNTDQWNKTESPEMEKAMAPHSSTLAWKTPWTEEPGRLQSMGSLRVRHDWATSLSRIGEGNGNPLQCSCLENPRDGGAWWAAVSGVAQSRTRLKRLSSTSSSMGTLSLTKEARIYNGEKTASSASSVRKTGQLSIKLQHHP